MTEGHAKRWGSGGRSAPGQMTDLELADLHLRTLYVHDEQDRLVAETADVGREAPRLALALTRDGCLVRQGTDVEDPMAALAEGEIHRGLAYAYPATIDVPDDVVRVTVDNPEMAEPTYPWMTDELRCGIPCEPCFVAVVDGVPAAAAHSARWTEEGAQAGIETHEPHRGRGLAGRVSAAWGAAVRELGREPIYSTSTDNTASQAVARKLGLRLFCTDLRVR